MLSSLKLGSRTILGKEETKKVNTILMSLMDSNDSYDFRQPVDWKGKSEIIERNGIVGLRLSDQESHGFGHGQAKNERGPLRGR